MLHKSITEAKAKLPELVNLVHIKEQSVVIRKHNIPVAVLIPFAQMPKIKPKLEKLSITRKQLEDTPSVFDKYSKRKFPEFTDAELREMRDDYLFEKYLR